MNIEKIPDQDLNIVFEALKLIIKFDLNNLDLKTIKEEINRRKNILREKKLKSLL